MFQVHTGQRMSAHFRAAAVKANPEIPAQIEKGDYHSHNWLKENVYQHGRKVYSAWTNRARHGWFFDIDPFIQYSKVRGTVRSGELCLKRGELI